MPWKLSIIMHRGRKKRNLLVYYDKAVNSPIYAFFANLFFQLNYFMNATSYVFPFSLKETLSFISCFVKETRVHLAIRLIVVDIKISAVRQGHNNKKFHYLEFPTIYKYLWYKSNNKYFNIWYWLIIEKYWKYQYFILGTSATISIVWGKERISREWIHPLHSFMPWIRTGAGKWLSGSGTRKSKRLKHNAGWPFCRIFDSAAAFFSQF